jgi:hypothetical protein
MRHKSTRPQTPSADASADNTPKPTNPSPDHRSVDRG